MWYKNVAGRFFGLVTKNACDGQTDGQNYDSQDRASIARAVKMVKVTCVVPEICSRTDKHTHTHTHILITILHPFNSTSSQ